MKILLLNQWWLGPQLQALGHDVRWASLKKGGADFIFSEAGLSVRELLSSLDSFTPDRIVYHDDSAPPWLLGLAEMDIPSLFYSVDTHHHHSWHPYMASLFDLTLVAQKDYLPAFKTFGAPAEWFPLWATQDLTPAGERPIDVSFRGTLDPDLHPQRVEFLTGLSKHVAVDLQHGPFKETYEQSKIVINETVLGDLNFRVFEALSGGALLVTPLTGNGLLELFEDGKDIVTYESWNVADAADKIRYFLAHDRERAEIAARGYAKVCAHHTADVRAVQLAAALERLEVRPKNTRFFSAARVMLTSVGVMKGGCETRRKFAGEAASLFERSAGEGEALGDNFVSLAVLCKCYLEDAGLSERADLLVQRLYDLMQDDVLLALTRIDTLLKQGKSEEAMSLARRVSDKPEELVLSAPVLMREVKSKVLTSAAAP